LKFQIHYINVTCTIIQGDGRKLNIYTGKMKASGQVDCSGLNVQIAIGQGRPYCKICPFQGGGDICRCHLGGKYEKGVKKKGKKHEKKEKEER
jgi:hypothetical protein